MNQKPQQAQVAKAFCENHCVQWKPQFGGCNANRDAKLCNRPKDVCVWTEDEILKRRPDGIRKAGRKQ